MKLKVGDIVKITQLHPYQEPSIDISCVIMVEDQEYGQHFAHVPMPESPIQYSYGCSNFYNAGQARKYSPIIEIIGHIEDATPDLPTTRLYGNSGYDCLHDPIKRAS